ncbi:hypothetical protein [Sulfobacillus thermosulfidooxidans]|uniref:hypothetical protein n=1 Tax=Sulfobacillus thermosulfidooxidans TaxID=28034 RepID=UPI0006B52179|nr:hypothetical protein [Sulfobacillus thermosulfidooxidans]
MRKRRIWLILSAGVAIFVSAGIVGYHRLQEPKQQIFAVTNQVLQAELALNPRESAKQLAMLDQYLVRGSQADFFTAWLYDEMRSLAEQNPPRLASIHMDIAQKAIYSLTASQAIVDYRLTVTHIYKPGGHVNTTEIVTLWLTKLPHSSQGAPWKVYAINFNFDPIDFPGRPDSEGYDTWNLQPAPTPPHGV